VLIADDDNGGVGEGKVAWNDTKVQDRGRGPTKGIGKLVDPSVTPVGINTTHHSIHAETRIGYIRRTGRVTIENIPLGATVSLFDAQGKLVRSVAAGNRNSSLSLQNQTPGVYCMRIDRAEGMSTVYPVVIEK
jgi:hypothetical protein